MLPGARHSSLQQHCELSASRFATVFGNWALRFGGVNKAGLGFGFLARVISVCSALLNAIAPGKLIDLEIVKCCTFYS